MPARVAHKCSFQLDVSWISAEHEVRQSSPVSKLMRVADPTECLCRHEASPGKTLEWDHEGFSSLCHPEVPTGCSRTSWGRHQNRSAAECSVSAPRCCCCLLLPPSPALPAQAPAWLKKQFKRSLFSPEIPLTTTTARWQMALFTHSKENVSTSRTLPGDGVRSSWMIQTDWIKYIIARWTQGAMSCSLYNMPCWVTGFYNAQWSCRDKNFCAGASVLCLSVAQFLSSQNRARVE